MSEPSIIVTIGIAFEAWETMPATKMALTPEWPEMAKAAGKTDHSSASWYAYGAKTGLPRLMKAANDLDVKVTLSTSALAAEQHPELARDIVAKGHELVGHGYSQSRRMFMLDEDEDREEVRLCTETLERITGVRPVGWSSQGGQRGDHTVDSIFAEGYTWVNDFREQDTPFVVKQEGDRKLIALPRTDEINDAMLFRRFGAPPSVYVELFKRAFDQLLTERDEHPRIITSVFHPTYYGHPFGVSALREVVEHARSVPGTLICTRRDATAYFADRI